MTLEYNKIYNMDCIEGMKLIPDGSIDAIITSPPYNFDMEYDGYDDNRKWEEYFKWLNKVWTECYRILKDDGRLIVNIQPLFSDYVPTHHFISHDIMSIGFKWKAEFIWEKNNYNCKYCSWGSWKSPSSPYIKYTWEFIEVYCKNDYKHKGDKDKIDITADEFKSWVLGKWSIAPERNMKKYGHPAMFPVELPYRCLKLFTYRDDVVLDPFAGAGTTAVACVNTGRQYIGFELNEDYCKTAEQRISDAIEKGEQVMMEGVMV